MDSRPIITDDLKREITIYDTEDFPLNIDSQALYRKGVANVPHWHHAVQICLVTKGSVVFQTAVGSFLIREGEGIFINSGVLHEAQATAEKESIYSSVNFDPELLYGKAETLVWRKYIVPVIGNQAFPVFPLLQEEWQRDTCGLIKEIITAESRKDFGYELTILSLLSRIWEQIVIHCRKELQDMYAITQSDWDRLQLFMAYIHKNYPKHLTLADIAGAGNVSRGECCRLFKRTRGQSPITYLTQYRIRMSINLLMHTDLSVAEISRQCGFSTSSYFAECFKKEIGMAPLRYRRSCYNWDRLKNEKGPEVENDQD